MKKLAIARFLSTLFVALCLAPSAAHLLELPHKISLSAADYLTVQQIYRGWDLLGIVVVAAFAACIAHVLAARRAQCSYALPLAALLCVVAAQLVFWSLTFPANLHTANWTRLPPDWERLRLQWEYSHAMGTIMNLLAFLLLLADAGGHPRLRRHPNRGDKS